MKFIAQESALPMNVKCGIGYSRSSISLATFSLAVDVNAPIDNDMYANAGMEYAMVLGNKLNVAFRGGYKSNTKGINGLSGISAGLGMMIGNYGIDYAWLPFGDLGDTHRVSLSIGL